MSVATLSTEALFELHRDVVPATCHVDGDVFLQRIREHEATLPEHSEQRKAWACITSVTYVDGIIIYSASTGNPILPGLTVPTRAIGTSEDEVIHNALSMPMFESDVIPTTSSIPVEKQIPCENRRRAFGIFETFVHEDKIIFNHLPGEGFTEYIKLVALNALEYSSSAARMGYKAALYALAQARLPQCEWHPKESLIAKVQDNSQDPDFLHIASSILFAHDGTAKSQGSLNILESWCPNLATLLTETRAAVSQEEVEILISAMKKTLLPMIIASTAEQPMYNMIPAAQQHILIEYLVNKVLESGIATRVMLRMARREFATVEEYVAVRDAEHQVPNLAAHTQEYNSIQEALAERSST